MPDTPINDRTRGTTETVSVDEAQRRVLVEIGPLPAVQVPLHEALDLTLAEDITARRDSPPFANSAMDGFAIRAGDTTSALNHTPVELGVRGEAAAGHQTDVTVAPGYAARIMTGAPVPPGADAVVRVEHTETSVDTEGERLTLRRPVSEGENIRPAGEDAAAGAIVLEAGTRIGPSAIGLLAAVGYVRAAVHPRPRVGVLVTGDEIVEPGTEPGPGQIWNSNGPMIAAHVRQAGGVPVDLGVAGDTSDAVRAQLRRASDLELLITTGGVSVGDFDVVKDVLAADGQIDLWNLRIKPGKPLAYGWLGSTAVIGLPGNPVAAAVAFLLFARPAILTMLGRRTVMMPSVEARILDRFENRGARRQFARVIVESTPQGFVARLAGDQGSAMLASLAKANGLLVVPEDWDVVEPGTTMTVLMPDWDVE